MYKVLIADKLSAIGLDWLKKQADVEIDIKPGLPSEDLGKIVKDYDGMIIRSGAKVTAAVLENPGGHCGGCGGHSGNASRQSPW